MMDNQSPATGQLRKISNLKEKKNKLIKNILWGNRIYGTEDNSKTTTRIMKFQNTKDKKKIDQRHCCSSTSPSPKKAPPVRSALQNGFSISCMTEGTASYYPGILWTKWPSCCSHPVVPLPLENLPHLIFPMHLSFTKTSSTVLVSSGPSGNVRWSQWERTFCQDTSYFLINSFFSSCSVCICGIFTIN